MEWQRLAQGFYTSLDNKFLKIETASRQKVVIPKINIQEILLDEYDQAIIFTTVTNSRRLEGVNSRDRDVIITWWIKRKRSSESSSFGTWITSCSIGTKARAIDSCIGLETYNIISEGLIIWLISFSPVDKIFQMKFFSKQLHFF